MRRSLGPIVPLATALILGACVGERDNAASRLNAPAGALAVGNPNACDFTTMTKDGKAAFSNTDPILSIISDMQDAYNARTGGGAAGATSKGLDVLAYIEQKRLTAAQHGTNAQVAALVKDVVNEKCTVLLADVPAATLTEFDSVEKSLAGGVFAVRGNAAAPAAVAFVPKTDGGRQQASPVWGVEPLAGCSVDPLVCATWPSGPAADRRYLLFAYPTTADLGDETAADDADFNGLNGFKIGMIPDITVKTVFTVGECIAAGTSDAANLLYHATTSPEIVGNRSPTFCADGYPVQAMLTNRTWFASLGQRAASWLAPKPLFAKEEGGDKFSGGGPSGWSAISFAKITGTNTALAIGKPPKTGVVFTDFELTVKATSILSGLPLPSVTVDIQPGNNQGVPAGATLTHPATGVTGPDGIVVIKVAVNKPGGYTFVASGNLIGGATTNTTITTSVVNVKSK